MEEREATRDINKLLPPIIVLKAEAVLRDCSVKTSTKDTLDANLQSFLEEKQWLPKEAKTNTKLEDEPGKQ